jgi:hypothetical protein
LKELCEDPLARNLRDDNCFELLDLADRHGADQLKEAALAHIRINGRRLLNTPDWLSRFGSLPVLLKEIVECFVY